MKAHRLLVHDEQPFEPGKRLDARCRRAAAGNGEPGRRVPGGEPAQDAGGEDGVADPRGGDEEDPRRRRSSQSAAATAQLRPRLSSRAAALMCSKLNRSLSSLITARAKLASPAAIARVWPSVIRSTITGLVARTTAGNPAAWLSASAKPKTSLAAAG